MDKSISISITSRLDFEIDVTQNKVLDQIDNILAQGLPVKDEKWRRKARHLVFSTKIRELDQ